MSAKLVPPDSKRCQTEIVERPGPFQLGGGPTTHRCENKPVVIATEKKPASDGKRGSMSLCSGCLVQFKKQMPRAATFRRLR